MTERRTTAVWVAIPLLLFALGMYVVGYFVGGYEDRDRYGETVRIREFSQRTFVVLYWPLGKAESLVTGKTVWLKMD